jgi:hypothetical protein
MAVLNEAQMTAAGFVRVAGAADRVQLWSGPHPTSGQGVMVAWDSTTGRRKIVPEPSEFAAAYLTLLATIVAIADFVDLTSLTAQQKNGIKLQLLAGLKDD